jgi:CDP-diacylglycerol---serine O-phosphatidyltransferase
MTNSFSDLGAQLDSLADALTFGVAPALIGKVLLEREGVAHTRVHFAAAAVFALMALLRLARFNVETDEDDDHSEFRGLPSPAAAGMLVSTVLLYLSVGGTIEVNGDKPTILGSFLASVPGTWRDFASDTILLPMVLGLLPLLGLLMVSRVRYAHFATQLGQAQSRRALIPLVLVVLGLFLIPTPVLFLFGLYYVVSGLWSSARSQMRARSDREKNAA